MPKLVSSSGIHLRGIASGQHSSEETSQRWRAVGDAVFDLTGLEMEHQPPCTVGTDTCFMI